MAAKCYRAIVCEGPDDLAAIRALLLQEEGSRRKPRPTGQPLESRAQYFEIGNIDISVESRNAKSGLAELAIDVAEGGAVGRPDMILVSFDPDSDPPAHEFAFFEKAFADRARARRVGPLDRNPAGIERFAGLPDVHCLERVLIDGILEACESEPVTTWAKEATMSLCALVPKHGYKRAFRIWNAALHPDAESFVPKLLQADEHKHACLRALRSTPAAKALSTLLNNST